MKEKLAEGKTKIIWQAKRQDEILIENKDYITAGDGEKRHIIPGKGIDSTETTYNVFRLLKRHGILNHFIRRTGQRTFLARKCNMIPIEFVARRIAYKSYLERNPRVIAGTMLNPIALEMFYKDDAMHDPLMMWNYHKNCFELHDAHKQVRFAYIKDLPKSCEFLPRSAKEVDVLLSILELAFLVLEATWRKEHIHLVDMKIEFGYGAESGKILIADVVDNDSWRIWPKGDKEKMLDKEVYRRKKDLTSEDVEEIRRNYKKVAELTKRFSK